MQIIHTLNRQQKTHINEVQFVLLKAPKHVGRLQGTVHIPRSPETDFYRTAAPASIKSVTPSSEVSAASASASGSTANMAIATVCATVSETPEELAQLPAPTSSPRSPETRMPPGDDDSQNHSDIHSSQSIATDAMLTPYIYITPTPGFVIETIRRNPSASAMDARVYLNVCHHSEVPMIPVHILSFTPADRPYLVMGATPTHVVRCKAGRECLVYNLVVSSDYWKPPEGLDFLNISDDDVIRKVMVSPLFTMVLSCFQSLPRSEVGEFSSCSLSYICFRIMTHPKIVLPWVYRFLYLFSDPVQSKQPL